MSGFIPEDKNTVKLKKRRAQLVVCGTGLILFGIWSVLRELMILFAGRQSKSTLELALAASGLKREDFIVAVYVLLAFDLIVRFVLGNKAIAIGRGKHQSMWHIIVTVFYAVLSAFFLIYDIVSAEIFKALLGGPVDMAVAYIVDFTAFINVVEIAVCSIKIHNLEKSGVK